MAVKYKYIIKNLQKQSVFKIEDEVFNNVVSSVGFEMIGEELIDDVIYSSVHYGVCPLITPSLDNFVNYEDLTEDFILQAVKTLYPIESVKLDIVKDIENQKNPTTKEEAFPWGEKEEQEPIQ